MKPQKNATKNSMDIRLMKHFDKDGLDDFIQTANSLTDWIRRDRSLNQHQRDEIERFAVSNGIDWQICNQFVNSQKHGGPATPRGNSSKAPALLGEKCARQER
jgi:hypothetical protein